MKIFSVIRGDRWTQVFQMEIPGDPTFDWTGVTVTADLRTEAGASSALFTFTPGVAITPGLMTVTLDLPGLASANLPDASLGTVVVARTSPAFGPYTPVKFQLNSHPR